jgi:hypothetical protein
MNKVLLDTDILSGIGKGLNPVVNANVKVHCTASSRRLGSA